MKRVEVRLDAIADWENLGHATYMAARGRRHQREVTAFLENLSENLTGLHDEIVRGSVELGHMRRFEIRDPKPRVIHAPEFRTRVFHHAVMAQVGPVLERALISDTFACRFGKGTLAAIHRCQEHVRRFDWYVKIDVRAYFASIDHGVLIDLLGHRLKGAQAMKLLTQILACHQDAPGRGLPIGALTSQHFANFYLSSADRYLLETLRVRGMVRYMDDIVWWVDTREEARSTLIDVTRFLNDELRLEVKSATHVNRSVQGVPICGVRVFPGTIRLSRRRRRRYAEVRAEWERAYSAGRIDAHALQAGYASAHAMTAHADAAAWRREQLKRVPVDAKCEDA